MGAKSWRGFTFVALIAGATTLLSPVPNAAADPGGSRLVTLGDSFTTTAPVLGFSGDGCVRLPTSWPNQLADRTGSRGSFVDVSCNGGSLDTGGGWTLVHQARKASSLGAFGPNTRAVLIQAGWNDTWGNGASAFPSIDCLVNLVQGCGFDAIGQGRVPNHQAVTGGFYANRIRVVVDFLRASAPNAKIVLVGYPEVFAPGQSTACIGAFGAPVVQPNAGAYVAFLDRLDAAQREAAGILGINFFDSRAVTRGHGSCAADSWINGASSIIDGAPIHPSVFGNGVVAGAMQATYGL